MPVVNDTVVRPDGTVDAHLSVTIDLVGASPDLGFIGSTDKTIAGRVRATVNTTTGAWSATLTANADISPAGTKYKVTVKPGDGPQASYYISVPATAGPFWVGDILTTAP